jgi:hypothetical protein
MLLESDPHGGAMATVLISDPVFKRLEANAAARKLSLEAYLAGLATKDADEIADPSKQLAAWDAFVSGMTQWTKDHLPAGYFVDDSRESMYEGRGE